MPHKRQIAVSVRRAFQILAQYPAGLSTNDLWTELTRPQSSGQSNGNGNQGLSSFEKFSFSCVGPIKAGWLLIERNQWMLSAEGRTALETYSNPEEFFNQAGRCSRQAWLAVQFPNAYATAGRAKDQLSSELRTIRRVGLSRLVKQTLGRKETWQQLLPIQSPRNLTVDSKITGKGSSLTQHLSSAGVSYSQGGHAIYLSPQSAKQTALSSLIDEYPATAGIKLVKNQGGVDDVGYINGRAKGDSRIHLNLVHNTRQLSLVANFLYAKGIGPRLYDLANIHCDDQVWTAYIVEDVGNTAPSPKQCLKGVERLRQLHNEGIVKVILPEGFDDPEFQCPHCSGNALVDANGNFRYIDFQNFLLNYYERFLTELAREAAMKTHFGDTSVLRGGRYLYQSVPGVNLPAKRDVSNRMKTLTRLFEQAHVSVKERVVLDIGCNLGMMMAQYLRLGAKWCHGWDRAFTIPYTERMLLALGCTRFSTTAADITPDQPMLTDIPPHVARSIEGCVISYLAIRGHINWLSSLRHIPWSFLIYEGHEGESYADFLSYLEDLRSLVQFQLGPVATYVDGDSEERAVALLLRQQ
jgi:hypothetical protein